MSFRSRFGAWRNRFSTVRQPGLSGSLNSRYDRFLNQLFTSEIVDLRDAAAALASRPGFVWLRERPATDEGLTVVETTQMTAALDSDTNAAPRAGEIAEVRTEADVDDWFEVYSAVFGADRRARDEWLIYSALGPAGEDSLCSCSRGPTGRRRVHGSRLLPRGVAGLYCYTTLAGMRGRGLATALVEASHRAAMARGVNRAVLQATGSGLPLYAKAGYAEELEFSLLLMR